MGYPINNTYTYLTFLSVPTIDGLKTIIRYLDDKIIFIRIEPDDRMHRNWTLAYYYDKVQIRRNVTKQSIMLCVVVHTEMRTCRYLILADFIAHCVEWPRYTLKKRFKYFKLEKKKYRKRKWKSSSEKEKCSSTLLVHPLAVLRYPLTPFDANKNLSSGGCWRCTSSVSFFLSSFLHPLSLSLFFSLLDI